MLNKQRLAILYQFPNGEILFNRLNLCDEKAHSGQARFVRGQAFRTNKCPIYLVEFFLHWKLSRSHQHQYRRDHSGFPGTGLCFNSFHITF